MSSLKRWVLRLSVLALGGLIAFGITFYLIARHMGKGTLQDWVGSQIQDIANAYLNPKLSFTDLAYQYPLSVSLKNLHLTADDPEHPGHTIDIIACDHAELSLAEIPQIGKPIVIQKIALTDPLISAVSVTPRSKKFVGFYNLIRGASERAADNNSSSAPRKLSDIFRMRLVQIINGKVVYDPRIPGTVPMSLDKINTLLNIEPADEGWYKLDTDISRAPVFDLSVKGQLNLDSFSVKEADISLSADLGQDKLDYLPPEIQALLKEYEAKGKLSAKVTGEMPLTDPMSGQIQAKLNLDRANVAMKGMRIPVEGLSLQSRFENHEVDLTLLRIAALGGHADVTGSVALNDRLDGKLRVNIDGMVPQRLLMNTALAPQAEDRLDLDLNVETALKSLFGRAPPPAHGPLAMVDLRNFRVSAADPVHDEQRIDLVACRKLDVRLTEPILSEKPLSIDSIELDSPVLSAVAVAPGSSQFVGVPDFSNGSSASPQAGSPERMDSPNGETGSRSSRVKLADAVRVRTFQLEGARVVYDPRLPHTQPMVIDPIDASLDIDPSDPGSYVLKTDIDQSPIFKLNVGGEIDIDQPALENVVVDLQADLSQGRLDFLPPQLQLVLGQFNAKEKLSLHAKTSAALSDLTRASAQVDLHVQNIDLKRGQLNVPVREVSLSAHLEDKKLQQAIKISALNSEFDVHSSTLLNDRLDTNVTLGLNNVTIEPIVGSLFPNEPPAGSTTILNAQIELQSPLMVALGAVWGNPGEPAATLAIRGLRLTTTDPITSQPIDFVACDVISTVLSALPGAGNPVEIGSVNIVHPAIRAIAMAPGSKDLAGFSALQNLAAIQTASTPPGPEQTPAPAPPPGRRPIGDMIRLKTAEVTEASVYYDPRIEDTVPLALDHIHSRLDLSGASNSAYRFDVLIPSKPDLNIDLAGVADLDSLSLNPLKVDFATRVGQVPPDYKYLPPQVQVLMKPYDPVADLHVTALGSVPLTHPLDSDISTFISVDDLTLTAGGYRVPIDAMRVPLRYDAGEVDLIALPYSPAPDVAAFGGTIDLRGTVALNDRMNSTLAVSTKNVLLQSILAAKIGEPKTTNIIGAVDLNLELVDAPILDIVAAATPAVAPAGVAPATQPASPGPSEQSSAFSTAPKYLSDLPASWGSAYLEVNHARLAGLEVIQGIGNLAKSAFSDIINSKNKSEETVVPKEHAVVVCDFRGDHVMLNAIHYEGEVVAADGKGYITLEQYMDLYLTGGLFQKLGGLGAVGNWIKQASDSLLYYHVYGTPHNIQYEVKRGDGKPFVEGAKKITKTAEAGIKTGLSKAGEGINKAGTFLNGLFHKKKQADQSTTEPAN